MDEKEKDPIKSFQEEIEKSGVKGGDDTFSIAIGDGALILAINGLPDGRTLAISLPPSIAFELGQALVNSSLLVAIGGEGDVDMGEISGESLPKLKKEELN